MIEQLFGSKTRAKLLYLFYSNPNRSYYVREITRKIDEQINSVRRELANLLSIGIIISDNSQSKLYYEVNQKFEHFAALKTIFGKQTRKNNTHANSSFDTKNLGKVELMIYTGQFTRDKSSGIDILVVGDINNGAIEKYIGDLEAQEHKELRYVVMTTDEFAYRRQIKDRFIDMVINSKKQVIVDTQGFLTDATQR